MIYAPKVWLQGSAQGFNPGAPGTSCLADKSHSPIEASQHYLSAYGVKTLGSPRDKSLG
jgi:hypothetical protein